MSNYLSQYKLIEYDKSIFYAWFEAMHTRIDIVLCNLSEEKSKTLGDYIYAEIERISSIVNRFDINSELSNLNNLGYSQVVEVSDDLFFTIKYALESHSRTNGYFDITVHSFDNFKDGANEIELDEIHKSIRFKHPNVQIDLGGIAKGYVLDLVVAELKNQGIEDFLINFGNSSIAAFGNHPHGIGWKVALVVGGESYLLKNEFLTVSGNHSDERKHILNPFTQQFVEGKMELAVVTTTGIEGEVLSTASLVQKQLDLRNT
jgi:FAD:protein FMN transferase